MRKCLTINRCTQNQTNTYYQQVRLCQRKSVLKFHLISVIHFTQHFRINKFECVTDGKVKLNKEDITLQELEMDLPEVETGGRHSPKNCIADERVAIIIPVREQDAHLRILLRNLHPFLIRQQRDYRIYVMEQKQKDKFNKGKLFNVGFMYALKDDYNCFVFHDVNWIPEEYSNVYKCGSQPVQLSAESVANSDHTLTVQQETHFEGVVALTSDQFKTLNGYSNKCKNGGENDDIFNRIKASQMKVIRKPSKVGRFVVMGQSQRKEAPLQLFNEFKSGINALVYPLLGLHQRDGLSNLEYEIIDFNEYKLYTRILTEV
ncbi:beta-1:4-N-acetylgalactosaminyltransferase bre-4-like protein [Leptotrombidium deliense]|uniref:Beta-1,4-N-acetylgalactosaminyltransferase n=1 Tax=Leptotrombidium deliense TaxID=299467 RepID=A0A443SCR6_9ACAR|nr:beta-1:4-N-acetylgalactosaminyltransferase bre-4-like protein [Leptotrombidium deliense]